MSAEDHTTPIEYRTVERFKGYRFTSDGRVQSCWAGIGHNARMTDNWRDLVLVKSKSTGHLLITMKHDGKYKATLVSNLIAEAFFGPRPTGMQVCHFPDRDVANNSIQNLRYDTKQGNEDDKKVHGTRPKGSGHSHAKINEDDVANMRLAFASGESKLRISKRYGLHHSTVGDIINGKTWRHTLEVHA